LGPRGMDKMIQTAQGEVVITNDGATILKHMSVMHPAARMVSPLPFNYSHTSLMTKKCVNSSSTCLQLKILKREMELLQS